MPRRKSPLHHPHDKLFQAGFRIPANAAAFLRGQLPQAVSARIAWSKLKQVPGHFVDGKMAKPESDLLFRVPFDRQSAFLYILFEHQHDKDPWIALRLLRYMLEIWREFLAKNPAATKLPPILPVVLAQNSTVWSIPTQFSELFDLPAADGLQAFIPDFTFRLIQLAEIPFDKIQGTDTGIMVLRTLKARQSRQLLSNEVWDEALLARLPQPILRLIFYYILDSEDIDKEIFRNKVEGLEISKLKKSAMTLAEQLHEEGMQQGMQRGQILSNQKSILEALKLRFKRVPVGLREEIQSISDLAKLQSLLRAAITSPTLDAFAGSL